MQEVECGELDTVPTEYCVLDQPTHASAVKLLMTEPQCLDEAITALETVAAATPSARRDLAAAYYTRAQREDRASDLLRAYDEAQKAVEADRTDPIGRFNLALVQEAIGLDEDALVSWKAVPLTDEDDWNGEVLEHRRAVERRVAGDPVRQWNDNKAALRTAGEKAVAALIAPFPKSAFEFFEKEALSWDDANAIQLFARQLSKRLGDDPYPLDLAAAAARGELDAALHLSHERERAVQLVRDRPDDAMAILDAIEADAIARRYTYLCALIRETRGYVRLAQDRYLESTSAYDAAIPTYAQLRDHEGLANVYRTNTGTYRLAGQYELSWRDALRAKKLMRRVAKPKTRHGIDGEIAATALALGHPEVALVFQDRAVAALRAPGPGNGPPNAQLRFELGVAKRERARIETALDEFANAEADLSDAAELHSDSEDAVFRDTNARRILEFRLTEVRGRKLMREHAPAAAAEAFTAALGELHADQYRSFRATLLVQRAEAYRALGRAGDSQRDLEEAVAALAAEQKTMLEHRQPGKGEPLWSSYFSRFDDANEGLIEHLIETGETEKAFHYAERSRAFELLDLARGLPFAPRAFLDATAGGEPVSLADLQRHIPAGTWFLQFCVTENRIYTFVISQDSFDVVRHDEDRNRTALRRRAEALQREGRSGNELRFEAAARAAYAQLLRDPFATIAQRTGGRVPRIVIVPDDAMHGMPFAALWNLDTDRWVVYDTIVEVAASASMYVFTSLRRTELPAKPSNALLIGDPAFDEKMPLAFKLTRLPAALGEVNAIRARYGSGTQVLTEEQATIPAFIEHARDKSVLHFAGHSLVNARSPWTSMLLFAPSGNDRGVLEAQDLLTALTLERTQLVVLAACSSAGGLPVGSEGVGPLVRPLIARGAPAVVGTLWPVNDATAAEFFVSFHQDYGKSGDAAGALRAAQLAQLGKRNPGPKSILAWAPFQVVGH